MLGVASSLKNCCGTSAVNTQVSSSFCPEIGSIMSEGGIVQNQRGFARLLEICKDERCYVKMFWY